MPNLPISIPGDGQDLVVEDDSHDMVAGASYDAMDLEDENKDAEDNHNYHHCHWKNCKHVREHGFRCYIVICTCQFERQ